MKQNSTGTSLNKDLRRRAENMVKNAKFKKEKDLNVQKVIHELQVHQIELEMQNDELSRVNLEGEKLKNKYYDLYNFSPVGFCTLDRQGHILELNFAGCKLFAAQKRELLTRKFQLLVAAEHKTAFSSFFELLFKSDEKKTCEIKLVNKKGISLFVYIEGIAFRDSSDSLTTCRMALIDITQRKLAEEAKNESEKKYRQLVDLAQEGIWSLDAKGITTFVNPFMAEMLGYTPEEMLQKPLYSFMDESGIKICKRNIEKQKLGIIEDHNFEFLRKDGKRIFAWMSACTIKEENGNYAGALAVVSDITVRKKIEESLQKTLDRYRSYNLVSGQLGWVRNAAGEVEEDIPFWRAYTGQAYEEVKGWGWLNAVHPDDKEHAAEVWKKAVASKGNYEVEYRLRGKDGIYRFFLARGIPTFNENGSLREWVGTCIDITKHKEVEKILKRDKDVFEKIVDERTRELIESQLSSERSRHLAELGTLAATVAHELRNPLNTIKLATYSVNRKNKDRALDGHIKNIDKKVQSAEQIINNLLSFARMEKPAFEKVNIGAILDECLSEAGHKFSAWDVKFISEYSVLKGLFIEADPVQIAEVFNNILNNACEALKDNKGTVQVSARYEIEKNIRIIIQDNGIGIDPEDIKKLGESFFSKKAKGTGLGLSVCYQIIRAHAGKLDIDSEKGKWTVMSITLPLLQKVRSQAVDTVIVK